MLVGNLKKRQRHGSRVSSLLHHHKNYHKLLRQMHHEIVILHRSSCSLLSNRAALSRRCQPHRRSWCPASWVQGYRSASTATVPTIWLILQMVRYTVFIHKCHLRDPAPLIEDQGALTPRFFLEQTKRMIEAIQWPHIIQHCIVCVLLFRRTCSGPGRTIVYPRPDLLNASSPA